MTTPGEWPTVRNLPLTVVTLPGDGRAAAALRGAPGIATEAAEDPGGLAAAAAGTDCLVVEHDPPTVDAPAAVEAVRAAGVEVPVLVLAGDPGVTAAAYDRGATEVLSPATLDAAATTAESGDGSRDGGGRGEGSGDGGGRGEGSGDGGGRGEGSGDGGEQREGPGDGGGGGGLLADRVAALAGRRAERDRLADLFDATADGLILHDPETGDVLATNDTMARMVGRDPETVDRLDWEDVVAGEGGYTESEARDLVRRAAAEGPTTFEWIDRDADGEAVPVEVTLDPVALAGESCVLATVREVSEREGLEAELVEGWGTLRELVSITSEGDRPFEETATALVELCRERFDAERGVLAELVAGEGGPSRFEVVAAAGRDPPEPGDPAPEAERALGGHWPGSDGSLGQGEEDGPRYLGVPAVVDGDLYGAVYFAVPAGSERAFTERDRTLVELVVEWVEGEVRRRRARTERREAETRFERTLERIEDAVFAVDDEWRITYANDAGAAVLREAMDADHDREALLGLDLWAEVPDAVDTEFYERYHEAMATQEPVTFEAPYDPLDVRFEVTAYPDEDGLSIHFRDVTERYERERELLIRKRAMDQASIPLCLSDPTREDNPLVYVNDAFEAVTGYDAAAALGRNCRFLQGEDTDPAAVDELRAGIEAEEPTTVELLNYRADGEPFWNQVDVAPIYDGDLVRYLGTQRDVTERREREGALRDERDRFTKLFEAVPDPAVHVEYRDGEPIVRTVNPAFESTFGVAKDRIVGESINDHIVPPGGAAESDRIDERIRGGDPIHEELPRLTPAGERTFRLRAARLETPGDAEEVVAVYADVTDRVERRRRLTDLLERTEELTAADSPEAVAHTVVEAVEDDLGAGLGAVYLREEGRLRPVAATGAALSAAEDGRLVPLDVGEGPAGRAVAEGTTVVYDPEGGPGADGDASAGAFEGAETGLAVPLGDHGAIHVGATDAGSLGAARRRVVELLAATAASALDRAEREAELGEYETVFETVEDMLYVLDGDGRFEMVSPTLADRLGYDRSALVGEPAATVLTDATVEETEGLILEALVTPEAADPVVEGAVRTADGEEIPVELELSLLPYEDSFRGTVGVVRDISERRRRERELGVFRQAVDAAGIGLVMYDAEGEFAYVNQHYADLLGFDRGTLTEARVWDVAHEMDADGFERYFDSFSAGETRVAETAHRRVDGSTVRVELVTSAVDIEGARYHVVTAMEVTHRRERRQQTEVLHRILRHNLRNDLSVAMGHARLLAEELSGDRAARAREVVEACQDLVDISASAKDIEELLGRETTRRPVDVVALVEDELAAVAERHDVTVETDLPGERSVAADDLLRRALYHLLENAVVHNDADDPHLAVAVRPTEGREGWVDVEVRDNGPGIPEAERAVLLAGEETALEHGSGLGLWLVHWTVTRYGGELRFEAVEPRGSRVTVSLPAADQDAAGPVIGMDADAETPGQDRPYDHAGRDGEVGSDPGMGSDGEVGSDPGVGSDGP